MKYVFKFLWTLSQFVQLIINICSVDSINKRSSYVAVKSTDASGGFDGTPVHCKASRTNATVYSMKYK